MTLLRQSTALRQRLRLPTWVAAAVLCGLIAGAASAAEPAPALREGHLRLLYAESLFTSVNRNDARAAIKTWVETLGRRRGFALTVEIAFYGQLEDAAERLRTLTVDMINCPSEDWLRLASTGLLEPVFLPGWNHVTDDYVLLTRRGRGITTLADLRGKRVAFYRTGSGLGRRWMDATLRESGLGAAADFFGAVVESPQPSAVILPVFFGKADAAVAKRASWEMMKELNPQLGIQLQIVAHSPTLPDAVVCLTSGGAKNPFRDDLLRGTVELHSDPQGQQILLLFRTDRIVPFKSEQLDGVRTIAAKLDRAVPAPEREASEPASGKAKP